jgi:MATE family multidrug resistance protein
VFGVYLARNRIREAGLTAPHGAAHSTAWRNLLRLRRWTREVRPLVGLSLPIVAGMVGHMLMGLTDTIMVGRIGVVPLAAAAFVNTITHLPLVFALGLLSSISVLTAQGFGARQAAVVGEVMRHGILLAAAAGIVTAAAAVAMLGFIDRFGQPAEVVAACPTFLILFGLSMLPALISHGGKVVSDALNRPWPPTLILLGGVLLNVLLNWILIFGHWGAPALGLTGSGLGTLLARSATAIVMLVYLTRAPYLKEFNPVRWFAAIDWSCLRRLLKLGFPVGVQHLLEVSAFSFAALMMGWISAEALAAHQIAITCAATTFMFAWGIAMAVTIRVGQAWGAGFYGRMRRVGFVGVWIGAGVMAVFAVVFILCGETIAGYFVDSNKVILLAAQLLLVAGLFQIADGVQIVSISALRGLADVRVPAWIAVLAYWILAVPLAYFLAFHKRSGAVGIWIALAFGLGVAACTLLWRWHLKSRASTAP